MGQRNEKSQEKGFAVMRFGEMCFAGAEKKRAQVDKVEEVKQERKNVILGCYLFGAIHSESGYISMNVGIPACRATWPTKLRQCRRIVKWETMSPLLHAPSERNKNSC